MTRIAIAAAAAIVAFTLPASAQWLNLKTPGIPRTPDGKPILSGPAPKTADAKPDLSGLWREDTAGTAETSKALDTLKPLPWAAALAQKRKDNYGSESPSVLCLPPGPVVDMGVGKLVQTPNLIVMLWGGTNVSRDLSGWQEAVGRSQSGLDGLFGRSLGGGHAGDRQFRV